MGLDLPDWSRGAVTIARGDQVATNSALPESTNLFIVGMAVYQTAIIQFAPAQFNTTNFYRMRYTHRINNNTVAVGQMTFVMTDDGIPSNPSSRRVAMPLLGDELIISFQSGNPTMTYDVTVYASTRPSAGLTTANLSRSTYSIAAGGSAISVPAGDNVMLNGTSSTGTLNLWAAHGSADLQLGISTFEYSNTAITIVGVYAVNASPTADINAIVQVPVGCFGFNLINSDTSAHAITTYVTDL